MKTNTLSIIETFRPVVFQMPQVAAGQVSEQRAEEWLHYVSRTTPANQILPYIYQCSGVGANDIRALVANERNEYYPGLSAAEILETKRMSLDSVRGRPVSTSKMVFTNLARQMVAEKLNLARDRDLESVFSTPINGSWKVGRPAMVLGGDQKIIVDIQFEDSPRKVNSIEGSDQIKLHHYDLVAAERNVGNTKLMLVKVAVEQNFWDAISALCATSPSIKNSLVRNTNELIQLDPSLFTLKSHFVSKDKQLYPELIEAGNTAWRHIFENTSYQPKVEPSLTIDSDHRETYVAAAKQYCAAETVFRAAKQASDDAKQALVNTAVDLGINSNHKAPFSGAEVRSYDRFDKVGAAKALETEFAVDKSTLCDHGYDADAMAQVLTELGVNPAKYRILGEYSKDKIIDAAEQIGVDLNEFKSRELRAIYSRKTRGPIFDALAAAKQKATPEVVELQRKLITSFDSDDHKQTKSPAASRGISPR